MQNTLNHTFHIPVMGTGFTVDTPVKVAHYGISSVISLVDDSLLEKMRRFYSEKWSMPFQSVPEKWEDFRAKRITAYLNLIDDLVKKNFEKLKASDPVPGSESYKYLRMLPAWTEWKDNPRGLWQQIKDLIRPGSIDVNIMTKIDNESYKDGEKLPDIYRDAHAALRGFANSKLHSSVVFSAGMNPRLYSYISNFSDFFPDKAGNLRKKVILKVSDYRSARIQGTFLAKKGIWVTEFRVESGINCGGHAFVSSDKPMSNILQTFKENKQALREEMHQLLKGTLEKKGMPCPDEPMNLRITAQGGVGTAEEHAFLLEHYQLDSIGWGTPFLLVPEAVNVDDDTLSRLCKAREEDLYLSNTSPLGIPFNTLRNNTQDIKKEENIKKNRPGSSCPKGYIAFNTEFTDKKICTASRQYQHLKLKELEEKDLSAEEYDAAFKEITEKSCICTGLGTAVLLNNNLDTRREGKGVSICPGPNMAYFSKVVSLQSMTDHIYGRNNVIERKDRPHMFINEMRALAKLKKEKENSAVTG